jgi:hypothetical protein
LRFSDGLKGWADRGGVSHVCRWPDGEGDVEEKITEKAVVVTKERLFPRWKVCDQDFGRDDAGPSTCGYSASGG